MRLAALFSGGKDSTYAIYLAEKLGHIVEYLLTVYPESDESLYFHYPNIWLTRLQAQAMRKEHLIEEAGKRELEALSLLLDKVENRVEGIVSGAVASRFQYEAFGRLCREHGLKVLTPLWKKPPLKLLQEILSEKFKVLVTGVAAEGLGQDWLGAILTPRRLRLLEELERKLGVNPVGEGGEFETLVLDCPLFRKRLKILSSEIIWMGDRGFLKIEEAKLVEKI